MENPSDDIALERIQGTPLTEVAALLFAETFRPEKKPLLSLREVHRNLAHLAGLSKPGLLGGKQRADYLITLECTILWEHALLAARMWIGDSASLHVQLLRRGEAARHDADPLSAARAALKPVLEPPGA